MFAPMYTEKDREDMKHQLDKLLIWLEENDHIEGTEAFNLIEQEAKNLYEIIHDL
jgi:hypothetical protein